MLRPILTLFVLAVLAACRAAPPDDPTAGPICAAEAFRHHVGQPLAGLDIATLPEPYRIIGPDTAVTLDHRPDRLNVTHDDKRVITNISCG